MAASNKSELKQLAACGGAPTFAEVLHVGRPNIGNRDALMARLHSVLDRRWLSNNGACVQEFERRVAEIAGVRHCIATCNGEIGLEIAIRALDLKGEVIVPAFTFIASAHALQWQEIAPVFADVHPVTHLIDPASVERLITPRTTAIMGVHLWGQACDVEALEAICRRRRLRLLFDAAHAFGCTHRGRPIGGLGDVEVFSFHATKFVNSLEGGAVTTNDDDLARKIRLMKNFGFRGYDDVGYVGTNGKMNEFAAAVGLTSIESMDEFITLNRRNYEAYRQGLKGLPGIRLLSYGDAEKLNYQYVVADVDPVSCPLHRDEILDLFWSENVQARRYFYPGLHRMEPYRSYFPNAGLLLPHTERVSAGVLILPTGQTVTEEMISAVCGILKLALAYPDEIRGALRKSTLLKHPRMPLDR